MSHILDRVPAGIIFDLDGTLLDTEPLYTVATQRLLDPFGHTYTVELKKQSFGGDSRRSAALTIDAFKLPLTVDEYLAAREVHLLELFKTSPEIPGAGEFVHALSSRLPIGLATSSHRNLADAKLADKSWKLLFDSIVCGDSELVHQGKPAPDIFLACAAQMNVPARDCLVFEDSPPGISAALKAGMRIIAVKSPYVTADDLSGADLVIQDYRDIIALIKDWQ